MKKMKGMAMTMRRRVVMTVRFFKKESFVYVQSEKRKMVSEEGKWGRLQLLSGFGTRASFCPAVQPLFYREQLEHLFLAFTDNASISSLLQDH